MKCSVSGITMVAIVLAASATAPVFAQATNSFFTIKVVDDETGRGVPLVELKTTSKCRYYTDSQGIIAFHESSLMNQQVYFSVFSHGYECEKDAFDERGVLLRTTPGDSAVVRVRRINIAERLYRITGQDIYGASATLGRPRPIKSSGLNGKVAGQDTFIETLYKGKLYWFWGDTFGPANFNGSVSGATSELPERGGLDPAVGIDLTYFVDSTGFSRPMCPIEGPGLVWIDWLVTVPDGKGGERLYAKFSRTRTLSEDYERGIAVFNDKLQRFEKVVRIDAWLDKVHSSGHPVRIRENDREYIYIIDRYGIERVIADSAHLTNGLSYEHFTCLTPGTKFSNATSRLDRNADGQLMYAWKPATDAVSPKQQEMLVSSGKIKRSEGLWQTQDIESGRSIGVEPVSVFWNDYHRCWVMLAYEFCGSIWYFEGDTPVGPWVFGRKIITHENYDFYNVGQHPLFDQDGGRVIYFEGTYTTGFSGNSNPTPLYDYNQMMYRLSLDDSRLALPAPVYRVKDTDGRDQYLMRSTVDSLKLWERIVDIPFFAIPPDRVADKTVPVAASFDRAGVQFVALRHDEIRQAAAFRALPMNAFGTDQAASASVVLLYEYIDAQSGGRFYSVDAKLDSAGFTRTEKPICRVWKNPSSMVLLDYKATQVPYTATLQ
jgi:hypothetical protein